MLPLRVIWLRFWPYFFFKELLANRCPDAGITFIKTEESPSKIVAGSDSGHQRRRGRSRRGDRVAQAWDPQQQGWPARVEGCSLRPQPRLHHGLGTPAAALGCPLRAVQRQVLAKERGLASGRWPHPSFPGFCLRMLRGLGLTRLGRRWGSPWRMLITPFPELLFLCPGAAAAAWGGAD